MVIKARIPGLEGWIGDLDSVDLSDAAENASRAAADVVVDEADTKRRALQSRFGSYARVKLSSESIRRGSTVTVGPRRLSHAAEFGAQVHPVFGRFLPQASFSRQVWPPLARGGDDAGWLLSPAVREAEDEIVDRVESETVDTLNKAFPD